MKKYAILASPGHNRVYFEESKRLAKLELDIVLSNSNCNIYNIKEEDISSVFYLTFNSKDELNEENIANISRLSFLYAFFEVKEIESELCLLPICKANIEYINSNISSILKYTGKTNEIFTRMMINIALFSYGSVKEEINILDPIAGKGTTLYEGLILGLNSYGIEISDKVVLESYNFMKKFLEREKFKHTTKKEKISAENSKAIKYSIELSKSKTDIKERKSKKWVMVAGNSKNTDKYFKKDFFNIIVGDLPYGVQHSNVTNEKKSGMTRNPKELLNSCIDSWNYVLKKDGVILLSWNSFLLSRKEFGEILENRGFTVLSSEVYLNFEHRVDQSIKRDIIVAKKNELYFADI